jgi:uncharacterized protein
VAHLAGRAHVTSFCGFGALIIQDVANLSLSCPKRSRRDLTQPWHASCSRAGLNALPLRSTASAERSDRVEDRVAIEDRGFASMDRARQREIASKGGKAAHVKGTAHEWSSEEAREAGRKGGMATHRRKQHAGEPGTDRRADLPTEGTI